MAILITGAGGFIGKTFLSYLNANTKNEVISLRHSKKFLHEKNSIYMDLSKDGHVSKLFSKLEGHHIEVVFHFAAVTPFSKNLQITNFNKDLKMARHVNRICSKFKIKTLVFSNGWIVYDKNSNLPIDENSELNPNTGYGKSKLVVENYFKKNLVNTTFINLRLATIYGPGQTSSGLIPNLVKSALETGKMTINSLETKRDYLFVDDVMKIFEKFATTKFSKNIDLNIGSGKSYSVLDIAVTIQSLFYTNFTKSVDLTISAPLSVADLKDNLLDIAKARKFLKHYKTTEMQSGLLEYIRWMTDVKKIIFFDLDGTLLDINDRWYQIHKDLTELFSYKPLTKAQYIKMKRAGISEDDIISKTNISQINKSLYIIERIKLIEDIKYLNKDKLKPEVDELLKGLCENFSLILLTKRKNRLNCLKELDRLNIRKYFRETKILINTAKDKTIQGLIYKYRPVDAILIGDTEDDLIAARSSNITCLLVSDGARNKKYLSKLSTKNIFPNLKKLPLE